MALAVALVAPVAAGADARSGLRKSLARAMDAAPADSGAYVRDGDADEFLFARRDVDRRILASNTKLFTTGAALARYGDAATLPTRVLVGDVGHAQAGTIGGSLFLVGGGDPAFGSRDFVRANYGGGADVETLAQRVYDSGLRVVQGAVVGDETLFDSRRGTPPTNYGGSGEIGGPLSALAFNHGLKSNGRFQTNPPEYAAARFASALRRLGVKIGSSARAGRAPADDQELARVESPPMATLARLTNQPSDNYFAELLAKGLGGGTTAGGAQAIRDFAATRGVDLSLADGSGLSRSDRTSPHEVVRYLIRTRAAGGWRAFSTSLATAGVNGTLADRMTSGPAYRHCHGKTGTLIDVSALSGYCRTGGRHRIFFSILMNRVSDISRAHELQDKMAQSIANYAGGT